METSLAKRSTGALTARAFSLEQLRIKRPFWTLFGRTFRVFGPDGRQVMYAQHPVRWRDTFKVFTDERRTELLLSIEAHKAIAMNMTYSILDGQTGELVGTLRKRGLKSIVRDVWDILDASDQAVGLVTEEGNSVLRRIFPLLRGKWRVELAGQPVAHLRQHFRFFVKEFELDLGAGQGRCDPRLAIGAALLALTSEISREQR
jgi:hypothetical protein